MRFLSILAFAVALCVPTIVSAGGIAVCMSYTEGSDGIANFDYYSVARSETAGVTQSQLTAAARADLASRNTALRDVSCEAQIGSGYYALVRLSQMLNGELNQLMAFGSAETAEAARRNALRRLRRFDSYMLFEIREIEPEILDEGRIEA
jgi:hypothetical protein